MSTIRISKGKYGRIDIQRRFDNGLFKVCSLGFRSERDFKEGARTLEIDVNRLKYLIDQGEGEYEEDDEAKEECYIRGRLGKSESAVGPHSFDECLGLTPSVPEPIIYWSGTDLLACLDVDYHTIPYEKRPTPDYLLSVAGRIQPRPFAYWTSHGRGIHAVYRGDSSLRAGELAAVGGLSVLSLSPTASVEIKASTRHPGSVVDGRSAGEVHKAIQTTDYSAISAWLSTSTVSEEEVEQYLIEHNLSKGARYDHSRCPVDPEHQSTLDPVIVYDGGIYCHSCSGRGVALGHRTAGWFPFSSLCGARIPSAVSRCIANLTHWEHAKYIIEDQLGLRGPLARAIYGAANKLRYRGDPRLASLFTAGKSLIRFDGYWGTERGEAYRGDIDPILARLPGSLFIRDDEVHVDTEKVARLGQPLDITDLGYAPLRPIYGLRIYSHFLPLTHVATTSIVLQTGALCNESNNEFRPRYVGKSARLSEEAAWAIIEEVFPGVERDLVRLLIVAKGYAEGRVGLPPLVYISGPTSSAKTGTVLLAAALCGDNNTSVIFQASIERVRQGVQDGKDRGSFVTFNEICKEGKYNGKSLLSTFHFVLNLTPDSVSHKLYHGPVRLSDLPVIVFTDTQIPPEIKTDAQLARRLVHVQLHRSVDWQSTLRAKGISDIRSLRVANPLYAKAADAIVSGCIEEFFSSPSTFEDVGDRLGYPLLTQSLEAQEGNEALRMLFARCCAAVPIDGMDARRWAGRGWKLIVLDHPSPLQEVWSSLCDEGGIASERCNEAPWSDLLGTTKKVGFEVRSHGRRVAIRFVNKVSRKTYEVNEEICNVPTENGVEAVPPDLSRLRDTECGGPESPGWDAIPARPLD